MKVLVFGQGRTGTTVIAKTIQHSLPGASFLMEPKTEQSLLRARASSQVAKILHGQWRENLPGLSRILRNESPIQFDKIVKTIRDPRDQAISFLLYNYYELARDGT